MLVNSQVLQDDPTAQMKIAQLHGDRCGSHLSISGPAQQEFQGSFVRKVRVAFGDQPQALQHISILVAFNLTANYFEKTIWEQLKVFRQGSIYMLMSRTSFTALTG